MRIRKILFIFVILITTYAHADSLSYSGRLVNTNGSPVVGPVNLKFDLVSTADTSTILCTQTINSVSLTNGVFHVKLDLDCGTPTLSQVLASIVSPNASAIRVTNLTASKTYSFQELHAVPTAQVAHGLSKLNANNNEVLTWTGSKWEPKPVTGATGGTVTDITAGTGLSGGTITNSGTISIANGGVTDTHLAGNIARTKLSSGSANSVLVNNASGVMSEVAQLPISHGGTGSNTAAGARTNLGLGSAATTNIGYAAGNALPADNIPVCLPAFKLQFTGVGPTYWSCAADNDTNIDVTKLPLAGGTMSGDIDMGTKSIINLANPVNNSDAVNKQYVDSLISTGSNQWTLSGSDIYRASGSVAIGTTVPNASSILEVQSTTKGFLPPRMTTAQKTAIASPSEGLVVFDTTTDKLSIYSNGAWTYLFAENEVSFLVSRAGSNQSLTTSVDTVIDWTTKSFDTATVFNITTNRFVPTKPGKYFISLTAACTGMNANEWCRATIRKNGTNIASDTSYANIINSTMANTVTTLVDMNGSTDYLDTVVNSNSSPAAVSGSIGDLSFSGFLINGAYTPGSAGAADDLGNHTALQNIILGGNWISSDGGSEGLRVDASGNTYSSANHSVDGVLRIKSDNANYVELKAAPSLAGTISFNLPGTVGTSGQALVTDGAGNLSWTTVSASGASLGGDLTGTVANAQIAPGAIYNADIANLTITYAKLNILDEEFPIAKLSGTSDATKYLKGNKTWGTFLTDVLASPFATVTPSNTAIANGDTLQTVVNKTQGQINNLVSSSSNYLVKNSTDTISGAVSVSGSLKIPATPTGADLTDVANVQYVQNYVGTFGQWTKTGANLSYSAGNVGIGIASPWDQFMVYKANNVATASIVSDNTSSTTARYPSIAVKNFGGGGAGSIGNPGIELVNLRGNSSAAAVLKSGDTLGGISFSGSTATNGNYKEGSNIRSVATQNYTSTASGGNLVFATTANSTTTPVDRMLIDQNGYVGIGTLAPSSLLHLSSTGGQMMLLTDSDSLHTDVGYMGYIRGQDSAANNVWYVGDGSSSAKSLNILTYQTGYPIYFGTSTGTTMTVSDDKVGIGTISPSNRFHVDHAVNSAYVAKISNGGGDGQGLLINASDGSTTDTQPLLAVTNYDSSLSILHVQGNGNVGIGTSTPGHKLHVNGSFRVNSPYGTDTGAAIYSSSGGGYGQFEIGHSNVDTDVSFISMHSFNNTAWTQGIQGSSFVISNTSGATKSYNDVERFTITTTGNVGINTTSPTYRLDVNGNIRGIGITDASDVRLKNSIVPLRPEEDLEKILMLNSVSYFWNDRTQDPDKQIGYIAQEMEKIYPELVETDTKGMKSVNYSHMVSPITNAIKALHTKQTRDIASLKSENEKLRDENAKMKKENDEIKARLDRLEKALLKQK